MKKIFTLLVFLSLTDCIVAQQQYGWVQKASLPAVGRHRSTMLACGNRVYLGLGHVNSVVDVIYNDWWEYDPGSDSWSQKANYGGGQRFHATGFTIGNYMYVGTGRDPSGTLHSDYWKFDPTNNTWAPVASLPGAGRRGAVSFSINGYGYSGTGSYNSDWYKYDATNNTWSPIATGPPARTSSVAMSLNGKGYCGTGDVGSNTGDWWEYNPTTNSWTQKATLTGLPRMEACGFAFDGKCFVGTGDDYSSGTNYQDFWAWDPSTNTWTQVTDFAGSARRYLAATTLNGRVYAGTGTSGMNYNDFWEYGSISGIEETDQQAVNVYPVPSLNQPVHVQFSKEINSQVTCVLYDISGKAVRIETYPACSGFMIEQNGLANGTYTYSITAGSDFISTGKLIFQ